MRARFGIQLRRLLDEATAGVVQKSSRSVLTIIGVALGIGSFIAVLGVTSSANGQISEDFNSAGATQIAVQAIDAGTGVAALPPSAESSVAELAGVKAAGTWWDVTTESVSALPPAFSADASTVRVLAASPGYWKLVEPHLVAGRTYDNSLGAQPVAVLGRDVAKALAIGNLELGPTVYVNGHAVTVIGIIDDVRGSSAALASVTIPADWAASTFGSPGTTATLTIDTRRGATEQVAGQIPLAIDARHPDNYRVTAPPGAAIIRDRVNSSTQSLFLALAIIGILVGAVGIANASLVSVMSRVPEIGLRRALGALPRHIAAQFLIEAAIRGLLGGALGASLGLVAVSIVALALGWTAVIEPWSVVAGPLLGAVVGLGAGLYPALQASRIEPVETFRR